MDGYVASLVQTVASPQLGLDASGALFNTYGEAIEPAAQFKKEENWRPIAAFLADQYARIAGKKDK